MLIPSVASGLNKQRRYHPFFIRWIRQTTNFQFFFVPVQSFPPRSFPPRIAFHECFFSRWENFNQNKWCYKLQRNAFAQHNNSNSIYLYWLRLLFRPFMHKICVCVHICAFLHVVICFVFFIADLSAVLLLSLLLLFFFVISK